MAQRLPQKAEQLLRVLVKRSLDRLLRGTQGWKTSKRSSSSYGMAGIETVRNEPPIRQSEPKDVTPTIVIGTPAAKTEEEPSPPHEQQTAESSSLTVHPQKTENTDTLPIDMMRLATKNQAYRWGLQMLKTLNLEEDDLWDVSLQEMNVKS